jgi:hypothetical protein
MPEPAALTADTTAADIAELRAQIDALSAQRNEAPRAVHPLARFKSVGEWATAVATGQATETERFAWVDQITTDNDTLIRPHWLDMWKGRWDTSLPFTTAFGTQALPADGMEIEWPIDDVDPAGGLVGLQTTEKTEITSVKVSFSHTGKAPVRTFAGGSDVSWQLLQRSSPSYRDRYVSKLVQAQGLALESMLQTLVLNGTGEATLAADATATEANAVLVGASLDVADATGSPASFIIAGRDAFLAIAKTAGVYPSMYGPSGSPLGRADASTLRINVSGLDVTYAPRMTATKAVISNRETLTVWAGPVTTTDAPNVSKLGTDIAVYRYAAMAAHYLPGIVILDVAPAAP